MKEEEKLHYLTHINDWFKNLENTQLETTFELLDQGYGEFFDYINENFKESYGSFLDMMDDLKKKLKSTPENEVEEFLIDHGLQAAFAKKIVLLAKDSIRIYFDSKKLREISLDDFKKFTSTMLNDLFVFRKYHSPEKLAAEIGWEEIEDVEDSFVVIRSLFSGFYKQNIPLDEITRVLEDLIELDNSKTEFFNNILLDENTMDKVTQYFLMEKMIEITEDLSQLNKRK